ncbi:hypothetical protein E4U21_003996, partial [Claviceps maximensis]
RGISAPVPHRVPTTNIPIANAVPAVTPTTTPIPALAAPAAASAASKKAHRHTVYYSNGPQRSAAAPSAPATGTATGTAVWVPAAPANESPKRQTKTLGRRLSEYFRPPMADAIQGRVCLSH